MDLVLQLGTQSHAHRVCQYFQNRHSYSEQLFPAGYAEQVIEVGPHTTTDGPCLALFQNVKISPQAFNTWLNDSIIGRSVMRVFWLQQWLQPASSRWGLTCTI
eukprot:GHRR01035868.1.p1 GENE.GHRR01035868.1~~GHRR01035868.1.p1  ORF type:complete len:103 (+),score=16.43 GHRR01035868.1:204-512(+)